MEFSVSPSSPPSAHISTSSPLHLLNSPPSALLTSPLPHVSTASPLHFLTPPLPHAFSISHFRMSPPPHLCAASILDLLKSPPAEFLTSAALRRTQQNEPYDASPQWKTIANMQCCDQKPQMTAHNWTQRGLQQSLKHNHNCKTQRRFARVERTVPNNATKRTAWNQSSMENKCKHAWTRPRAMRDNT